MPVVKVTHIDQSQNGKARVYFDGKNSWQDAYYIKNGLYAPTIGMTIEAETSSQTFPGKKHATWFLNKWTEVKMQEIRQAGNMPIIDAPAKALAGWDIQSGDLSRYASNIVASAITAGLVKEPHDVLVWTKYAYKAGNGLKDGFKSKFEDEFNPDGPDPSTHAGDPAREEGDPGFDDKDFPF